MRLTVEEDRETIKRYDHIKPARAWGVRLCKLRCPGTQRACTLENGHRGPHVAHGVFNKVVAVWDVESDVRPSGGDRPGTAVGPRRPREVWTGGPVEILKRLWSPVAGLGTSVGDIAALVLFLGFVVFAIQWFLRIFS